VYPEPHFVDRLGATKRARIVGIAGKLRRRPDAYCNGKAHRYADSYLETDGYTNRNGETYRHAYREAYGHTNRHGKTDGDSHAYADSELHSGSAARSAGWDNWFDQCFIEQRSIRSDPELLGTWLCLVCQWSTGWDFNLAELYGDRTQALYLL
jgi:hypothetical protein